ncbi:hypothetical protein ACH44C_02785 [Streptomyces purpureus]|uniref:hypothetical protein n=1 Tax=Streptomyces purpureus TaxID=1951 RepID=UPI000399D04B|nr:hypothetical protein [Streptomyces purpureus]
MGAPGEMSSTERMTLRFHLHCLATLVPYELRTAVLDAWLSVDKALFFAGMGPPTHVTRCVTERGDSRLRAALAAAAGGETTQLDLVALDDPAVDAALVNNPQLREEPERRLRLRAPALVATGRHPHPEFLRWALLSPDPDLAAAALVDRRIAAAPTARATAWATVRRHGGTARIRDLVARITPPLDPLTAGIAQACGHSTPEPYLDTVEEHWLGTGALLRRLRAVEPEASQWRTRRAFEAVLKEPYRIHWPLIAAARLGGTLPRPAACLLALRPDCPPEVAVVLRTGRPALPGRPLPAPTAAMPATRAAAARKAPPWVPPWHPPGDTGPLGDTAESARQALAATPVAYSGPEGPTLDHLAAVIERGQLPAADVAELVRPACVLTSWVGQASGCADVTRAAWSGRAALHVATAALLARWTAGEIRPERWIAMYPLIRNFPGTLPELLDAVSQAPPTD